jgi:tetratricopeptide (TPR) repeat protein
MPETLRSFETVFQLALTAVRNGNVPLAAQLFGEAVAIDPGHAPAHCNLGVALAELRQFAGALASYDRAVALNPDYAVAHSNRGNAQRELGRAEAALASLERAIAINPEFAQAYLNRGRVLQQLARWDEALADYDRALAIDPELVQAHSNRGMVLRELNQFAAALESYDRAIALDPGSAESYLNRGVLLTALKRMDLAKASYNKAIAVRPNFARAYFNRAVTSLLTGDFENGWIDYEWRWQCEDEPDCAGRRDFRQPLWLGAESLAGRTILLHGEQGLGDTLQFCRYAKPAANRGARVILEVQRPLAGLLPNLEGVSQIVARGDALPNFDFHCPLMSLPLAFKTRIATVPSAARYLEADAERTSRWRARLAAATSPCIGLAWSGSATNRADRYRSVPLVDLAERLPPQFRYVSLHKHLNERDRDTLRATDILDFSAEQDDFCDAAALCECMDLVISVDTSLAHLSAALGGETWILLSDRHDWRWLLDRVDSPWYPTVSLYRQESSGDWGGVLDRVAADLLEKFPAPRR